MVTSVIRDNYNLLGKNNIKTRAEDKKAIFSRIQTTTGPNRPIRARPHVLNTMLGKHSGTNEKNDNSPSSPQQKMNEKKGLCFTFLPRFYRDLMLVLLGRLLGALYPSGDLQIECPISELLTLAWLWLEEWRTFPTDSSQLALGFRDRRRKLRVLVNYALLKVEQFSPGPTIHHTYSTTIHLERGWI